MGVGYIGGDVLDISMCQTGLCRLAMMTGERSSELPRGV